MIRAIILTTFLAVSFGAFARETREPKLLNYNLTPIKGAAALSLAEKARAAFPEKEKEFDEELPSKNFSYSIGFGGWSHHNTGNKPNIFNEVNPTLELDILANFRLFGGRPLVGIGRTFENSRNGSTDFAFAANQWTIARGKYADLCVGGGILHAKYRDGRAKPGGRTFVEGAVPLIYSCLEFNDPSLRNFSVRAIHLSSKITLVYLVHSW